MDYAAYGQAYFDATGILVSVLFRGKPVYSALAQQLGVAPTVNIEVYPFEQNPSFCAQDDTSLYAMIQVEGTEWILVLGPVFNMPLTQEVLSQTMQAMGIEPAYRESMYECLSQTPVVSPAQLVKHMTLIHLTLNGKMVPDNAIYDPNIGFVSEPDKLTQRIDQLESGDLHNSYYFEVGMYQKVREGNVEQLTRFFEENRHASLNEGRMAFSPLRHAKNVFISTVAKTGFIGAIPGGLDIETAYQLMDEYIRKCEQATTVEEVTRLRYGMVLDLCRRTGENQRPANISTDVWHCMNFIRSHIYQHLSLEDVAADLGKSTSYVRKRFIKEVGMPISAFITHSKLEEAKTLLVFSAKSLAEISFDLCFSSQSYFQKLFKQEYNITPAQYRRLGRTI